jgi:hypothetical protein
MAETATTSFPMRIFISYGHGKEKLVSCVKAGRLTGGTEYKSLLVKLHLFYIICVLSKGGT